MPTTIGNCPIVTSYPENIKNNIDAIVNGDVDFIHPFLSLLNEETIAYRLVEELSSKFSISEGEIKSAVHAAWKNWQPAARICAKGRGNHPVSE